MTTGHQLDVAIEDHRLLQHPFYVQWRAGTLPRDALATYAAEYGSFIGMVAQGWEAVGRSGHADEEREHALMWDWFAAALGTAVRSPDIAEVARLAEVSRRLFADPSSAWGALYAFEAQQPGTAQEKLDGLVAHYGFALTDPATEYFRVHASDYHEAEDILNSLDRGDMAGAEAACHEMAAALWTALDGILEKTSS